MTANCALVAMARAQPFPGQPQHLLQDQAGEIAQVVDERLQRQRAGEVLRQQAQRLHLLEVAQDVHLPLGVAGVLVELAVRAVSRRLAQSGASEACCEISSSSSTGCCAR